MKQPVCSKISALALAVAGLACSVPVQATVFSGTLYYTNYNGGNNVNSVSYSYDDVANNAALGSANNIAALPGADGIIFAPNGNLLIGGAGTGFVYEVTTAGALVGSGASQGASYHLALDPSGNKVWTSNFGGALVDVPIAPLAAGTLHGLSGSDTGLTQVAFTPGGNVFYVNGSPNGFGNVGLLNMTTFATTRLYTSLLPAHGMIYDPYTSLITLFGDGAVGTIDATTGGGLKTRSGINCDFDQGAVDGQGHALIAGCNSITFIDYRSSGDITDPTNPTYIFGGFGAIDDVAPLTGLGSNPTPTGLPEPSTMLLAALGLLALGYLQRQRTPAR
ncbi:PEP-CTERM sorting domain-containing protein [Chitinivorax sp. PXF-14]|uniref:PEP-CTERM sorting domain-containing protein n=1 Tax=Chitinivorax sp. PXF-14 TaxID=3230488 RepID=UPI003465AB46